MSAHESQRIYQYRPEVVDVGIFARIDVLVDEYGIMDDVVLLDDNRSRLHDAPKEARNQEDE